MQSRLVRFLSIVVLFLVGLEVLVRANSKYFYSLSDRMLLNIKILEREPETKILFLGTSRFLDAIDYHVFTDELESRIGRRLISFNGAATGLQSERLAYFSKVAAGNEGLTHVIIEASPPSMGSDGKIDLPGKTTTTDEGGESMRFPDRFEKKLQSWFVDSISLVTYRKALRPKTLVKLFVLYSANRIDSNIWSRKRPLEAIFLPANEKIDNSMITAFKPTEVTPGQATAEGEPFENLKTISDIFKNSNIEVIWVAPPVSKKEVSANHNATYTRYYETISHQSGQRFLDYAGQGWEEKYLRDPTHLNPKGRNLFSKLLAVHLAGYFVRG